jgi:NADH-quinone oxidoreductase subunit I
MPAPRKTFLTRALLLELLKGLWLTLRVTFKPKVTVQYPLERAPVHPNYRGILRVDESLCIACMLCEKACPDNCIHLDGERGYTKGKGGKYATYFYIDHARCMFCGLCEEVCPVDAIYHSNEFEAAVYHRADSVHDLAVLHSGHAIVHYER